MLRDSIFMMNINFKNIYGKLYILVNNDYPIFLAHALLKTCTITCSTNVSTLVLIF
jgi:hypothetical protein